MIVPGSPFAAFQIDHPFAWYAIVREKKTGKQMTYWINGNQLNRENVADFIAMHYTGVDVITIDECKTMPIGVLQPVPASHFEHGHRIGAKRELMGITEPPPFAPRPITLRPISLKPLFRS